MREVTCLGIATPSTDAYWIVLTGISACIDLSKVGTIIGVRGCPRDEAAYAGDWSARWEHRTYFYDRLYHGMCCWAEMGGSGLGW